MFLPRWIPRLLDEIQRRSQFFAALSSHKEYTGLFCVGLVTKVWRKPIRFELTFILGANHGMIGWEEFEMNNISYVCRYGVRVESPSQLPNRDDVEFCVIAIRSSRGRAR